MEGGIGYLYIRHIPSAGGGGCLGRESCEKLCVVSSSDVVAMFNMVPGFERDDVDAQEVGSEE